MLAQKLSLGDTIGIIAPAGAEKSETINKSIDFFHSLGFNVKEGKHIYKRWGYMSAKDEERAEDFMNMFMDDEVKMILCIRGGYGSMRILPYIDFEKVSKNPKIFAGFSDITALLNAINKECGLVTFHSPMCNSDLSDRITFESFSETIMRGIEPYSIDNRKSENTIFTNGTASGKIVGGNLSIICSLMGTPYEIEFENNLLFIEEVNEEPYNIDRMLTQLLLSGRLKSCSGIILGQFTNCSLPHYERSLTVDEVISDRILSLNKPTAVNFMSGHSYPKLTLPIGSRAVLDCLSQELRVIEPVVK